MSNTVRVHQLAKDVGLSNAEVIRALGELGIEARSHSSSVSVVDARRLRDSLGRSAEDRAREEADRRRREQEELERYRSVETVAPVTERKAAKVLPPHLRKQQEAEAAAAAAAAEAAAAAAAAPASAPSAAVAPSPAPSAAVAPAEAGAVAAGDS